MCGFNTGVWGEFQMIRMVALVVLVRSTALLTLPLALEM
jgi:hypothetical protein